MQKYVLTVSFPFLHKFDDSILVLKLGFELCYLIAKVGLRRTSPIVFRSVVLYIPFLYIISASRPFFNLFVKKVTDINTYRISNCLQRTDFWI